MKEVPLASAIRMMVSAFGCKFANHTSGFFSILVVRAPIEPGCPSIFLHKLTEFQQELLQVGAILKGENVFTSFPDKIGKGMNVRQGKKENQRENKINIYSINRP